MVPRSEERRAHKRNSTAVKRPEHASSLEGRPKVLREVCATPPLQALAQSRGSGLDPCKSAAGPWPARDASGTCGAERARSRRFWTSTPGAPRANQLSRPSSFCLGVEEMPASKLQRRPTIVVPQTQQDGRKLSGLASSTGSTLCSNMGKLRRRRSNMTGGVDRWKWPRRARRGGLSEAWWSPVLPTQ